ncbi:hypothetical protein CEXT_314001 [Caerostris extrusa]|uniref:Uncharacterized protein n=1 Tax=Caerostris extrusa TaxID=172846 RepID=A0AAV4PEU8_CAEEX|nr:hypothetical protein CEXT_314001 [Caerostris extrusa]
MDHPMSQQAYPTPKCHLNIQRGTNSSQSLLFSHLHRCAAVKKNSPLDHASLLGREKKKKKKQYRWHLRKERCPPHREETRAKYNRLL